MKNNSLKAIPDPQSLAIAVRGFAVKNKDIYTRSDPEKLKTKKPQRPSDWVLVFDTETTTDAAQSLRFGSYQVRKSGELKESGFFYNPDGLSEFELLLLDEYVQERGLKLITVNDFIDKIFYGVGYACRATIVGFNLPFDISRLAIDHAPARSSKFNKIMKGGFSFKLSDNSLFPRVQIKHVSSRNAFIQFAAPSKQRAARSQRKKKQWLPVRRGFFIDCKTLAAALTSQSHSLASLGQALRVASKKQSTDDHGARLTQDYIEYAMQDTQTTWECYEQLIAKYNAHGLKKTPAHAIHSEASLGKAYLKEMGICPWQKLQQDFPPELLGNIMSAYYGGRSEIHIRKTPVQVLYCDFLSMYPTVCTIMGLWRFVTASGMDWSDTTEETRQWLNDTTLDDLQSPTAWQQLTTLVQVLSDKDIFPVRAKYGGDAQYTIGANYLTSDTPLWYTLADCMASKLLTGRAPKILQAITFKPRVVQKGLQPVRVAGQKEYTVDPNADDFFKRVIDLRRQVKGRMKTASPDKLAALDSEQLALKLLANATSYGIFVELNVEDVKLKQSLTLYGASDEPTPINMNKFENSGTFFHPLLATLITGAARLKLAITERLADDAGLDWAFCDTDSMALAKPEGMDQDTFLKTAKGVQEWFTPLNPYDHKTPLLKIEDENFSLSKPDTLEPLYCYAVSSKRYALFNLDEDGKPILRKVSEHGLGHLLAPYTASKIRQTGGAKAWQADFWFEIIEAALEGRQPDFGKLKNFDNPAISRYGATSPRLLKWFDSDNQDKHYADQVKPFNFLLAATPKHDHKALKPVSAFNKDSTQAVDRFFDRATGTKVDSSKLRTYQEALAQYHLHPETKFLNGDYTDSGITERRHILVDSTQHIGKEANKWEEQAVLGLSANAQIEYGFSREDYEATLESAREVIRKLGVRAVADATGLSQRYVLGISKGVKIPSCKALADLLRETK